MGVLILGILWHWSKRNWVKRHICVSSRIVHFGVKMASVLSVALNWKRDFGCETIRGYADIHVLYQYSLSFCLHQCLRVNPLEALIWDEQEGF